MNYVLLITEYAGQCYTPNGKPLVDLHEIRCIKAIFNIIPCYGIKHPAYKHTNEINFYKMKTKYLISAMLIFLISMAVSAGCATNTRENAEKQTIDAKEYGTDKKIGHSATFLKNIINSLKSATTDTRLGSAFKNNSTDKKYIFLMHQVTRTLSVNPTISMINSFCIIWHCARTSYKLCMHLSRILKQISFNCIPPVPVNNVCIINFK